MSNQSWFENWFNTHYYHLLYKHRDNDEAQHFIDHLLAFLNPKPGSKALDLACGRGRHSVYLNKKGLDVTGIDLSISNIEHAKQFQVQTLHFEVGDMRNPFGENTFQYVFNLFTSFGYFDNEQDDIQVLQNIYNSLVPKGLFIFDFFNSRQLQKNLCSPHLTKIINNIEFEIFKTIENGYVVKHIQVKDGQEKHQFQEKVKAIDLNWFNSNLEKIGFKSIAFFGNYNLAPYSDSSDRLIIVAQKN